MTVKHPHDAVIRAYLDGKTVQRHYPNRGWVDMTMPLDGGGFPLFLAYVPHRIKPNMLKYRVALVGDPCKPTAPVLVTNDAEASSVKNDPSFIRWATPWQKVEVNE